VMLTTVPKSRTDARGKAGYIAGDHLFVPKHAVKTAVRLGPFPTSAPDATTEGSLLGSGRV